jgi:hypothetical protein
MSEYSRLEIFAALDYHRTMRKRYTDKYSLSGDRGAKGLALFHSSKLLEWRKTAELNKARSLFREVFHHDT